MKTFINNRTKFHSLILTLISLTLILISITIYAQNNFIIRRIQINGLQGISRTTVLSYVPVKVGDRMTATKSQQIISNLFKTGFFDNISLDRSNNTLIINVVQRAIIGQIKITGNKLIPTKKLNQALQKIGFTEGTIFNKAILAKIKTSLVREYFAVGKYNARIKVRTLREKRNRVAIHIDISEGKTAKIHAIKIIGNKTFSSRTLSHQFKLATPGLFSFFTHDDVYTAEKLSAALESIRSYYLDRGYIKFRILSSQVSLTPDRKQIYITIHIAEGGQYHISGFTITGKTIIPKAKIAKLITIKNGDIFSRQKLLAIYKKIARVLGTKGYANADINAIPTINDQSKTVFLKFIIKPGSRIYVRHITFSGNYRTNDYVFRRELLQREGALLSTQNVLDSKTNLLNLPFIQNVTVTTKPVPHKPNQVDMNYHVTETSAATLQGGISYSQIEKFGVNASITQKNFLGTGNWLGLNLFYSHPEISLNFVYYNPYYTTSHIGRTINIYASRFDASNANITDYATDSYGFAISYDFPISAHQTFSAGYGLEHDLVNLSSSPSNELKRFKDKHGRSFYQGQLNAGWKYQQFDRYLFPTQGASTAINGSSSVPFSHHSLEYYKLGIDSVAYHPIYKDFIGQLRGEVNYGNGYGRYKTLPFFKNYYAGGIGSVRGYEGNSLGPKDSNGDSIGGKFELSGTAGLIFPTPLPPSVRTIWFVDGGNVYKKISVRHLRFSTGLEIDWQSPVGLLSFDFAKALNARKGDDTNFFQFTVGTSI